MQTEELAKLGLGVAVFLAIIAGIATVGGPGTGRMEKRDMARVQDLSALRNYASCIANARDKTLPDTLDPVPECPQDPDRTDPFSDAPYGYRKLGPASFQLCAAFELPEKLPRWQAENLDRETGCIRYDYHR